MKHLLRVLLKPDGLTGDARMKELKLCLGIAAAAIISTQVCIAKEAAVKIGLIGDSTVAVESGWGPAFADRFNDRVKVFNHAVNGATLESLSKKLEALILLKPDYVLIQFGHNDQKRYGTDVYATHLKSYVDQIRKAGIKPIIVSSVTRRTFDKNGKIVSTIAKTEKFTFKSDLASYAETARTVATENQVPFIDLYNLSISFHNRIGREASMAYNFKEGDNTHFNRSGGEAITDLILPELTNIAPELGPYLKEKKTESATAASQQ
jgi:pectinesterase